MVTIRPGILPAEASLNTVSRLSCAVAPLLTFTHIPYMVWNMGDAGSLGQFEQVVLAAILALGEGAYAVTIHARVEELAAPKKVKLGAIYATLDRLEDKGLIASWLSEPTKERGGRARRHYRLEKPGENALRESAKTAQRIYESVARSWGGFAWKPANRR